MTLSFEDAIKAGQNFDFGEYQEPAGFDTDFFKYDPKETGGIDWSTIYANQEALQGYGDDFNSDLLSKGIKFASDYFNSQGSGTDEQSQYFDAQKAASGLPTDKARESWYKQVSPAVGVYGGPGGYGGYGGGYNLPLGVAQVGQSIAGMNPGMQELGFSDYAKAWR